MAKTLDREIDLTEGRFFKSATDIVEQRNHDWFSFEKKEKFPWNKAYKKADGTFTNNQSISTDRELNKKTFGDSHWDYLGFKYYGGIENPLFLGTKEDIKFQRLALEEDYFYEMGDLACRRCGKPITILDLGSGRESMFNYLPPLCRNCLNDTLDSQSDVHPLKKYAEKKPKIHNKMTEFTVSLERP